MVLNPSYAKPEESTRCSNVRSRNRQTDSKTSVITYAKLLQRRIRTAVPARHRSISHVLQVVDAHSRGPEAGRRQIAEAGEERHAVRVFGFGPGRPRDVIKHRRPLRDGAVKKDLVEPLL